MAQRQKGYHENLLSGKICYDLSGGSDGNPTEFVVIGTKMVWALVGGSSGLTLFGVWLLARFTSTFDAYAGERAKIEAQFRNVEKLVANTEKLTTTTETIKAKVTDETWDRQQRWTAKHDMYRELVASLNAWNTAIAVVKLSKEDILTTSIEDAARNMESALTNFHSLASVAAISIDKNAYKIISSLVAIIDPADPQDRLRLEKAIEELTAAARNDLGYESL